MNGVVEIKVGINTNYSMYLSLLWGVVQPDYCPRVQYARDYIEYICISSQSRQDVSPLLGETDIEYWGVPREVRRETGSYAKPARKKRVCDPTCTRNCCYVK